MKFHKTFGWAVLILATAFAASPVQAAEQNLSGEELLLMVADVDVEFSGRGVAGITSYRVDGSARTELTIGISDNGQWWLDGDQVCTRWQRLRRGMATCFTITKSDDGTYVTSHGFTIRPLNRETEVSGIAPAPKG